MGLALTDLKLIDLLRGLPLLVKDDFEGTFTYNLVLKEVDGKRVEKDKYWVKISPGKCEWGEGHTTEPGACVFTISRGGVDTIIAMQVYGLEAATKAMLMGYIFTNNVKAAEKWFKILKIGKKDFFDSLAKSGFELTDTKVKVAGELGIE